MAKRASDQLFERQRLLDERRLRICHSIFEISDLETAEIIVERIAWRGDVGRGGELRVAARQAALGQSGRDGGAGQSSLQRQNLLQVRDVLLACSTTADKGREGENRRKNNSTRMSDTVMRADARASASAAAWLCSLCLSACSADPI
jgi:hypothetical protein